MNLCISESMRKKFGDFIELIIFLKPVIVIGKEF